MLNPIFYRSLFFSLALFMSLSSVSANTQLGHGLASCEQYEEFIVTAPETEAAFDAWVLGYLSGVNFLVYTTKGVDLLSTQNSETIKNFIHDYCNSNPKKTIAEAANKFWFVLSEHY